MAFLIQANEGAQEAVLPLGKAVILVGRDGDSNLFLDDSGISKNHASIIYSNDTYILRDNGSANGSFVNGVKVGERLLSHGDLLQFGPYAFKVDLKNAMPPSNLADNPVELSRGGNSFTRDIVLPEVAGMEKTGPIHVLVADVLKGLPEALPQAGFLAGLSAKDRQALAVRGTRRRAPAGTVVIRENGASGTLMLLLSGKWEARKGASNLLVGTIAPGEWVGEVNLFDPAGAFCSVVAVEHSEYWEITREDFEKFINDSRSAGSTLLIALAATLGARIRQAGAAAAQAADDAARTRKKRFSRAVPVLGAVAAIAILAAVGTYFLGDAERDRLVSEKNRLAQDQNETIEQAQSRANSLQASLDKASAKLKQAEAEKESLARNLAALGKSMEEAKAASVAAAAAPRPAAPPSQQAAPPPAPPAAPAPEGIPSKVVVVQKTIVPLLVSGKVAGSVTIPKGRELQVTGTEGPNVRVEFGNETHPIPKANTNFEQALAAEAAARANAPQPVAATTPAPAPAFETPPAPKPTAEVVETAGASTFQDLTAIIEDVKLVEAIDDIKALATASKSDASRFMRTQNNRWKRASKEAARLLALPDTTPSHRAWLKKIIEASAMCDAGRLQLFDAKLKEIDRDWIALKTTQAVESIMENGEQPKGLN